MSTGKVKNWNADRGFGFIKPDDGGVDVFFHVTALPAPGDAVTEGQAVSYEIGPDSKTGKTKAVTVNPA